VAALVEMSNVGLFPGEEWGLRGVDLELHWGRRYLIQLKQKDQLNGLLGIMEGRFKADQGVVTKTREYLCRSDRQLLGDKVYRRSAGAILAVESQPIFRFGEERRVKQTMMLQIKAWHLRHFPIYKLHGLDRVRFALLHLAFQETGLILLSQIFFKALDEPMLALFLEFLQKSPCALAIAQADEEPIPELEAWLEGIKYETIDLRGERRSRIGVESGPREESGGIKLEH